MQEIKNLNGSTVLSQFDYTYNPVGTIATWKQQVDTNTPNQYALSYDNADQLTSAVQTNTGNSSVVTSNAYNYDPAGNRLAETTLSSTTAGQFNNLNQLLSVSSNVSSQTVAGSTSGNASSVMVNAVTANVTSGTNFTANVPLPPGTNTVSIVAKPPTGAPTTQRYQIVTSGTAGPQLTYDANGNTLTDENGNTCTWDALNRLISITYPSGASSWFAYDGLSRRIQIVEKNSSGAVTSTKNYLWIGSEMAEERDASNAVQKRFFPQGEQQSGANYYYTRDHLRNVRELVDGSGNIKTRYSYDPYGRTTTTYVSGAVDATFQYAGMYHHAASGLSMTLYRSTYDPNLGRWLNRDPMEEEGGDNLYSYGDDDPSNEIDPLGLYPKRAVYHRPPPDFSVDPNSSDFPFIDDTNNFHWYGNWGGPHTTSGSRKWREQDNFPNDPKDPNFRAPINDRDVCYYRHDVCLHNSSAIKEPGLRQAARAACDHNLASCLCASKQGGKVTQSELNEFSGPNCVHCHDPGEYDPNVIVYPYLY